MSKKLKKLSGSTLALFLLLSSQAFADDQVTNFMERINKYAIASIGPAIFVLGIIIVGFSFIGEEHSQRGIKLGKNTIIGGFIISAAEGIYVLLNGFMH